MAGARCTDAAGLRLRPCALFVPPSSTTNALGHAQTAEQQQQVAHSHSCPLDDIESVLFSEQAIKQRVEELGGRLASEYRGKAPLVLGVSAALQWRRGTHLIISSSSPQGGSRVWAGRGPGGASDTRGSTRARAPRGNQLLCTTRMLTRRC